MNLQQLIKSINIADVISKDFDLKPKGREYYQGVEHDSLVVAIDKNYFYWNSCGLQGNSIDWLTKVKGLPLTDAIAYLHQIVPNVIRDKPIETSRNLDFVPNIYSELMDTFWKLGKTKRDYWYGRGYTDKTIDHFKLGYTGKCYVIPITFRGVLYNFQCLLPATETEAKKSWSWAKGLGALPFNFDVLTDSKNIILTEAPKNAIMLHQQGFSAVSQTAGANNWSVAWNEYFLGVKSIIVAYDNDLAGYNGSVRVAKLFQDRAKVLVWPEGYPAGYDPNDWFKDGRTKPDFYKLLLDNIYEVPVIQKLRALKWLTDLKKDEVNE